MIDADTGGLLASPALPAPAPGTRVALNAFEFDGMGGALLAMRGIFDATTGDRLSRRLVRVDLATAAHTPVGGEIAGQAFFSAGESTFDPVGRRLIFRGYDDSDVERLYVIDARTGALLASPAVPAPAVGTDVFLNALEYDPLATAPPDATPPTPTPDTTPPMPSPDTTAPETTIVSGPDSLATDRTPTFALASSEPGSFECLVDTGTSARARRRTRRPSSPTAGTRSRPARSTQPATSTRARRAGASPSRRRAASSRVHSAPMPGLPPRH